MSTNNRRLSQKYPDEMKELDELLKQIEAIVPQPDSKTIRPGGTPGRLLNEFSERLQRARKEFDALMFFTVCFGMLKSGKSTLVNLLAGHEEASPTRFGQDTTLRPCLLLAGEKDEIAMFHMKDAVKTDESGISEKKCFNAVIDYLRGVIDADELSSEHHVITRREPFTEGNIVRALCDREGFGVEPLITVVRLEDASDLLRSEIALLDVPGLDSDQMKPEISRYIELLDRCDLLLFIQSTVSALNHEAAGMLKSLIKRSKGSPVWLIQNRFEAQTWRKPAEIAEQDNNLAQIARQNLAKALSIDEKKIFSKQVNLGKAYDAHFREALVDAENPTAQLLEESGFEEVVKELSTKINEERLDIQLANCLNLLRDTVAQNRESLQEINSWTQEEKRNLYAFRSDFDQLIARLSSKSGFIPIPQGEDDPADFSRSNDNLIKTRGESWISAIHAKLDRWKGEIQEKMVGDDFNRELETKVREAFDSGPNEFFSLQSSFGGSLAEIFRRTVEVSPPYRKAIEDCQAIMQKHGEQPLEEHIPDWSSEAGPLYFDISPTPPNRVKGGRCWYGVKNKIEVESCRNKIDDAAKLLAEAAGRYIKRLKGTEVDHWFRRYRDEQIAECFKEQFRSRKTSKEEIAIVASQALDELSAKLPEMQNALEKIENFADKFRMEYNLA